MWMNVDLMGPGLSYYPSVRINNELLGKHLVLVGSIGNASPETVALSIVTDLLDPQYSPEKLTMSDLYYLFTLVKMNSLGSEFTFNVKCLNKVKKGKKKEEVICGASNSVKVNLAEADLRVSTKKYKIPTIQWTSNGVTTEYEVRPPFARAQLSLRDAFITQKGFSLEQLKSGVTAEVLELSTATLLLYLHDGQDYVYKGDASEIEGMLDVISNAPLSQITKLTQICNNINSYGIQYKTYTAVCKECGNRITFRLPILLGITG